MLLLKKEYTRYSKRPTEQLTHESRPTATQAPSPGQSHPVIPRRRPGGVADRSVSALMNLKPSGSGSRGWYLFTHINSYEYSLDKMRGKKCVYSSEFEKHLQTVIHTSHFKPASVVWVVFFHGSQRDIFFLLFPPCSSISKDAHELLTKTQFKCRRPSPCVSVFIKKPLLLENSGTTQVRQIQKKKISFPFVLPQRPTCPPITLVLRPGLSPPSSGPSGSRGLTPDGGALPRIPPRGREENHLIEVSLCSDLRPCIS